MKSWKSLNVFSLDPTRALDQVRAERARRAAHADAIESERRLEADRKAKLDHAAERERCGADADGIIYWFNNYVWTYDPRLIGKRDADGKAMSPYVPFRLWKPRQEEFIRWIHERVEANEEWLVEKSRDTGVSYLCCGYALNRWLFSDGFKTTFGSRKAEYVDKSGQPDSLFEKLRIMGRRLPEESHHVRRRQVAPCRRTTGRGRRRCLSV